MDVNALNFCRFSLLPLSPPLRRESMDALIAVPNLVNSALVSQIIGRGGFMVAYSIYPLQVRCLVTSWA
jgi:hypothetical protein